MKIIVAGGRDFNDYALLEKKLDILLKNQKDVQIISGLAQGADLLGLRYAKERGLSAIEMPADWAKYGRSAGMKRNAEMLMIADAAVCFWDGSSRGTKNMIEITERAKKPLRVVRY